MEDQDLLRYSRQILLSQVDVEGQQKILDARVLIIGLGGLGSPAAMYLAAAGVGHLVLADGDGVDLSNLQRQIIHGESDLGRFKVESARDLLFRLNPAVDVTTIADRLEGQALRDAIAANDLVLDCTDNFVTRFAINDACVATSTPLVSGAVIRFEGQITSFTPGRDDSPCYNCLYPRQGELDESCVRNGVIAPLPGIVGSMQALEALKLILSIGQSLVGSLLLLDALRMEWSRMRLRRNPQCPTCGERT
jgi:adenylyltransferase/sulfurtransferase